VPKIKTNRAGRFVLLTGATGFVGTRLRTLLIDNGYNLRVLTRSPKHEFTTEDHIVGDLTDRAVCRTALKGVDVVIHIAGEKRNPANFWPSNVEAVKNLRDVAVDAGVRRFVHLSSVGVIGADSLRPGLYGEDDPCIPRSYYERSKWEAEKLLHEAVSGNLSVAILRPANVFGDYDPGKGLLRLMRSIRNGSFIYIGGREVICNFIYVEDVAHACMALLSNPNADGHTYNLSDDCTLGEFVDTIADELGVGKPRLQIPNVFRRLIRISLRAIRHFPILSKLSFTARLISLNNRAQFKTSRLHDELGFICPIGWREGLRRLVAHYQVEGLL
jgi:nucleoside-diphosphate-sugar epimerase